MCFVRNIYINVDEIAKAVPAKVAGQAVTAKIRNTFGVIFAVPGQTCEVSWDERTT